MTTDSQPGEATDAELEAQVPQPGEQDVLDIDQSMEVMPTAFDITSFGADYPVDGLIKRLVSGDIAVPSFDPAYHGAQDVGAFQRKFVWSRPQMDKFIESLLLGLPVPGIFLIRDQSNKLMVLDGQQRLKTLQFFYSGYWLDSKYKLVHVQDPFKGLAYEDLPTEDRRHLDDSIIHATVLRQNSETGYQDAVYSIFERLNTGGSPLQPQEIRVALYPGPFLDGISVLNATPAWRALYGKISPRLKDHEMILRVLSMFENSEGYKRPLKGFMNAYLKKNQKRSLHPSEGLGLIFVTAMTQLADNIGQRAFRPHNALNAAVVDSISVGMMHRVVAGPISCPDKLSDAFEKLVSTEEFINAIGISTSVDVTVKKRLAAAEGAFASVR